MTHSGTVLADIPWTVGTGQHEGNPLVARFRQFPEWFPKSNFPIRLNIFWKMREINQQGLPLPDEARRLEVFENRFVEAVERYDCSVLSVVLTSNGTREFVLHTQDSDAVLRELAAMPQEAEPYPLDIYRHADDAWKYDELVTSPFRTIVSEEIH